MRREKHLWRLPALTRIRVSNDALLVAGSLPRAMAQWTEEQGWSLWVEEGQMTELPAPGAFSGPRAP